MVKLRPLTGPCAARSYTDSGSVIKQLCLLQSSVFSLYGKELKTLVVLDGSRWFNSSTSSVFSFFLSFLFHCLDTINLNKILV